MNSLKRQVKPSRFRSIVLGLLGGLCCVLLLGLPRVPAIAQINQATIQAILDGREVFIESDRATVTDTAQFRQTVRTEGPSRAELAFNNGAFGRLGRNASIIVGQCVEVESGNLLVSGPANGCISGFAVGVQGTMYLMETDDDDNNNILANLKVLEGGTQIRKRSDDDTVLPTRLNQGQKVSILTNGELGPIEDISPREYGDIVTGPMFEGYQDPLLGQEKLQGICQTLYSDYNCTVAGVPVPRDRPIRGLW